MRFRLSAYCLFLMTLILLPAVTAQDEPPPPQFLYRHENRLVLVNGYTGETTELSIEVADRDQFTWSPDGQYLLTRIYDDEANGFCLNLYKVDAQEWLYNEPVSCTVRQAIFSADGTHIAYSLGDGANATLWLFKFADETKQELYRTTEGDELRPMSISDLMWSPTETYLTFVHSNEILGGSRNTFVIMNVERQDYVTVNAPSLYYASYDPVWSRDDCWFLLTLQEEYVTSGTLPLTNHAGDVYLVNPETGDEYRLTYTPASSEYDVRWADDGSIAFTMITVIEQELTFTPEQAMKVDEVPSEAITWPKPVDVEVFGDPLQGVMASPDHHTGAWIYSIQTRPTDYAYELNIGILPSSIERTANFTIPIKTSSDLIGWRPSDYPYSWG